MLGEARRFSTLTRQDVLSCGVGDWFGPVGSVRLLDSPLLFVFLVIGIAAPAAQTVERHTCICTAPVVFSISDLETLLRGGISYR